MYQGEKIREGIGREKERQTTGYRNKGRKKRKKD
jgi:hypothetical protein